MKRNLFAFLCLFYIIPCFAQKQDRNWAFGYNCGIDFNDVNNPKLFNPVTNNFEFSASISDNSGELLIYVGCSTKTYPSIFSLYNGNNMVIEGGDDINTNGTFERGAIIIPRPDFTDQYYVFYTGYPKVTPWRNPSLFMSLVDMSAGPEGKVLIKDSLIMSYTVEEGIACVKHANGKDWWLVKHQLLINNLSSTADCFIILLINSSGISGPFFQHIGTMHTHPYPDNNNYPDGFACFSQSGNLMAYSEYAYGLVDLFNFDRCTGLLSNHKMVCNDPLYWTYGLEFSPNEKFLYITRIKNLGAPYYTTNYTSDLLQYNILSSNFITIWSDGIFVQNERMAGQLKLAPDAKIYLSYSACNWPYHPYPDAYNKDLCVINYPDLFGSGCGFQPFSFYLGDSAIAEVNLPNIPNYNLKAWDVYLASAGENKIICLENNPDGGVHIGSPAIPGLIYSWTPATGLDYCFKSAPLANPSATTQYTLTVIGSNQTSLCNTNTETVKVTVKICSDYFDCNSISVYPNPATDYLIVDGLNAPVDFYLYNLMGQNIFKTTLAPLKDKIYFDFGQGLYLYRIGDNCIGKIVIINKR